METFIYGIMNRVQKKGADSFSSTLGPFAKVLGDIIQYSACCRSDKITFGPSQVVDLYRGATLTSLQVTQCEDIKEVGKMFALQGFTTTSSDQITTIMDCIYITEKGLGFDSYHFEKPVEGNPNSGAFINFLYTFEKRKMKDGSKPPMIKHFEA